MDIIKLKDVAIKNIETDMYCLSEGCPTCGYGSDYCTEVDIYFNDGTRLGCKLHESNGYSTDFSVGYFVILFCSNLQNIQEMSKNDFVEWFKDIISKDFYGRIDFTS